MSLELQSIVTLREAAGLDVAVVGGKARALGVLLEAGLPAIDGLVVTTGAYRRFAEHSGLLGAVGLEFARRPLREMRDEELFEAALRIRTAALRGRWPESLRAELVAAVAPLVEGGPLVVRSSSVQEDSGQRSFAGLHDSIVGVRGVEATLDAVALVWASLFSERALLYRRADPDAAVDDAMAVVIQPLASSERSGIAFSASPVRPGAAEVEAVWGLGEGLVSGRVEPDRWTVGADGSVLEHVAPTVRTALLGSGDATPTELTDERSQSPALDETEVTEVWRLSLRAEQRFAAPQDCEWTRDGDRFVLVQSRPITVAASDVDAAWSKAALSVERLEALGERIGSELLPAMEAEAAEFAALDPAGLNDLELEAEVARRIGAVERWRAVYRDEFIAFAHGARVFGRFYADLMRPTDPFEFVELLVRTPAEYATHARLLAELGVTGAAPESSGRAAREARYLAAAWSGGAELGARAERLLSLGRRSWRLRDDDNLYLELVETQAGRAVDALAGRATGTAAAEEATRRLAVGSVDSARSAGPARPRAAATRPRQLVGQPASPGVASGAARVITSRDDYAGVSAEHVVVIDALEPDTAALASRAAAIVERRGGMLVHGAIVAREHGIPCVTGITDATELILDGERLTVDGFLGIVVFDEA